MLKTVAADASEDDAQDVLDDMDDDWDDEISRVEWHTWFADKKKKGSCGLLESLEAALGLDPDCPALRVGDELIMRVNSIFNATDTNFSDTIDVKARGGRGPWACRAVAV